MSAPRPYCIACAQQARLTEQAMRAAGVYAPELIAAAITKARCARHRDLLASTIGGSQ